MTLGDIMSESSVTKLVFWILGVMFAIVLTLMGWVQIMTQNRMAAIEARQNAQDAIAATRGERLAVLETMATQNKQDHTDIKTALKDVEGKLDEIKKLVR